MDSPPATRTLKRQLDDIINDNVPQTPGTTAFFFGDASSYAELVVLPAAALLRDWQCVEEIRRK
jgi:hypothetical protein